MTCTSHCLNCRQDYAPDTQSAHCPHRALGDPREVERAAKLKRKSEVRANARAAALPGAQALLEWLLRTPGLEARAGAFAGMIFAIREMAYDRQQKGLEE